MEIETRAAQVNHAIAVLATGDLGVGEVRHAVTAHAAGEVQRARECLGLLSAARNDRRWQVLLALQSGGLEGLSVEGDPIDRDRFPVCPDQHPAAAQVGEVRKAARANALREADKRELRTGPARMFTRRPASG